MIVVLDTNVLISAIFWRGAPYKIIVNALKKKYSLCLSTEILNELEEKLRLKFKFPENKIEDHIEIIKEYGIIIRPTVRTNAVKEDPDDNKVLECAVEGKADYIISGDNHLLKIKEFNGIKILTPKEFLDSVDL